tara:strand:+ start:346 stop:483 length:138 start_codon:yes stop_codon:yes gene_type:complete
MDAEYHDGMLDIPITFIHCGNEFETEIEVLVGLVTLKVCCDACMR